MKLSDMKCLPGRDTRKLVKEAAKRADLPTKAELARHLGVSRERIGQIARDEGLTFATFNRRTTRPHAAPAAPMHGAENE